MPNITSLTQVAVLTTTLLISACASQVAEKDNFSGFLTDYSKLVQVNLDDGIPELRWTSAKLQERQYTHVVIDPIIVYPKPADTEQVAAKTVQQATVYLEQAVRQILSDDGIEVIDQPQPNTIRVRAAITAVTTRGEDMKAYEAIPISAIIAGANASGGGRDRNIDAFMEVEITDINTDEVLSRAVKKGTSPNILKDDKVKVTMDDLKPTLDIWAGNGAKVITDAVQHK